MLIKINVIKPPKKNINIIKKTIYLDFYNVDILIFIKPYARNSVLRIIYVKFTIDIPFYLIISLLIYHI